MRSQDVFRAFIDFSCETLLMARRARTEEEHQAVLARTPEGERLWIACLQAGYTPEEGEEALARAVGQ